MPEPLTTETLRSVFDAFNRHDISGVMKPFANNCVFFPVAGPLVCGARIEGTAAIAAAFVKVWTDMPDAQWKEHRHFLAGDRAVSEWLFVGTNAEGMRIEAEGADLFTHSDGLITVKQAFRKSRPPFKVNAS
ncbi:nuclear transport factor 2 family protein [Hyphomonas sp. NPDC076900]|uniref:nuclear transport factor 2 family protein n=1 Tax=unclassified Hyphomonas TaxID=2630699 RepID=UPI003CFBEA2A